jgi:hypothetical protein
VTSLLAKQPVLRSKVWLYCRQCVGVASTAVAAGVKDKREMRDGRPSPSLLDGQRATPIACASFQASLRAPSHVSGAAQDLNEHQR